MSYTKEMLCSYMLQVFCPAVERGEQLGALTEAADGVTVTAAPPPSLILKDGLSPITIVLWKSHRSVHVPL